MDKHKNSDLQCLPPILYHTVYMHIHNIYIYGWYAIYGHIYGHIYIYILVIYTYTCMNVYTHMMYIDVSQCYMTA